MQEQQTQEIANRLHSTAIHLLRGLRTVDEEAGISARRLSALSVIVFGGPITISDLAQAEQVSLPTTSRMMKDMVYEGLVVRVPDEEDGRSIRIKATEKGRVLFEQARARRIESIADQISALSAEQQQVLAQALPVLEQVSLPSNHPHLTPEK